MRAHKCACLRLTGETDRVIQERRAYLVEEAVDEAQCGEIPDSGAGSNIHPSFCRQLGKVRHGSEGNDNASRICWMDEKEIVSIIAAMAPTRVCHWQNTGV